MKYAPPAGSAAVRTPRALAAVLIFSHWRAASGLTSAGAPECLAASVSYASSYIYMGKFLVRRGIGPVVLSACQLLAAGRYRSNPGRVALTRRHVEPAADEPRLDA